MPCLWSRSTNRGFCMSSLRVVRFESIAALRETETAWDDLWQRSDATLPTGRAELIAQWIEQFAPNSKFVALAVERDGQLVAALPLVERRVKRLITAGTLPWNDWCWAGDLLVDPEADVAAALRRWSRKSAACRGRSCGSIRFPTNRSAGSSCSPYWISKTFRTRCKNDSASAPSKSSINWPAIRRTIRPPGRATIAGTCAKRCAVPTNKGACCWISAGRTRRKKWNRCCAKASKWKIAVGKGATARR